MMVPGGTVPIAAVAQVSVQATHRRRGINTMLMRRQLTDIREWGDPLAVLQASESIIYGRYGYGMGSSSTRSNWSARTAHSLAAASRRAASSSSRKTRPALYSRRYSSGPPFSETEW